MDCAHPTTEWVHSATHRCGCVSVHDRCCTCLVHIPAGFSHRCGTHTHSDNKGD